jgi:hypothetical protein
VGCAGALAVLAIIGLPVKSAPSSRATNAVTTPTSIKQLPGSSAQAIRDECHLR